MSPVILRPGAAPVYRFLTMIASRLGEGDTLEGKSILECGAGGHVPPLALFAQHGLEVHGVDIDDEQLARARRFCRENGIAASFRKADMRSLPYGDASFDYVYEHFSICHLDPEDTARALSEMRRVLKPGGLAFFGFLSKDTWPLSSYGDERSPNVYCMTTEDGDELCHTMLADPEADGLAKDWEILRKDKIARIDRERAEEVTRDEWRSLHAEARVPCSEAAWMTQYPERQNRFTDVYAYYCVRKPAE
ncbi:MAG: class I SAM-dependent methyltransferase [Thermotogota bacterium]